MFQHLIKVFKRWQLLFFGFAGLILLLPLIYPFCHGKLINDVDLWAAFMRVISLLQCWEDGRFLGTWVPEIYYGQGYPINHYYSPLFAYLVAGATLVLKNPVIAMNMVFIVISVLSGVAMFLFAKDFWGKAGGFFSAVLYMYAPYHIHQVLQGGACGAFLAFMFLPLVFWGGRRCFFSGGTRWTVLLALALAGLILSHNLTAVMGMLVAGAYFIFLLCFRRTEAARFGILKIAGAVAAGLGLSAFFWLPVVFETKYISLQKLSGLNGLFYKNFFLPWQGFIQGKGELSGYEAIFFHLQVVESMVLLLFAAFIAGWMIRKNKQIAAEMFFFILLSMGLLYLTFDISAWLWELLHMAIFQLPFRWLVPVTFIVSLLLGAVACFIPRRVWRYGVVGVLSLIFIIFNYRCIYPREGYIEKDNMPFATSYSKDVYEKVQRGQYEDFLFYNHAADSAFFLPKWVKQLTPFLTPLRVIPIKGQAMIEPPVFTPKFRNELCVVTPEGALLLFRHFYFPGWEVLVDGVKTEINPENVAGYIMFAVPPGKHEVVIRFGSTPPRVAGSIISLVSLFGGLAFIAWLAWKRMRAA